jgi:hypothetical protein
MKPARRLHLGQFSVSLRNLAYFLLAASLVTVLAGLLLEPVRIYLALPLEFIVWLFRSLYLLIPRHILWVIFLVLAFWIAINSLQSRSKESTQEYTRLQELYGEPQIARIARYINLSYRPFYRHRLNHTLSDISLQVFAYRLQISQQQVRLLLSKDHLNLPEEFAAYFKGGLPPWPAQTNRQANFLRRWALSRQAQAQAIEEVEKALDFLEAYLEVPREH